jgi:hypothetical protein
MAKKSHMLALAAARAVEKPDGTATELPLDASEPLRDAAAARDAAMASAGSTAEAHRQAQERLAQAVEGIAQAEQEVIHADAEIEAARAAVVAATEAQAAASKMSVSMKEKAHERAEKLANKDLDGDGDIGLTDKEVAQQKAQDDLAAGRTKGQASQALKAEALQKVEQMKAAQLEAEQAVQSTSVAMAAAQEALEEAEKQLAAMRLVEERKIANRKDEMDAGKDATEIRKESETEQKADAARKKKAAAWLKKEQKSAKKVAKASGAPDDWEKFMGRMPEELMSAEEAEEQKRRDAEPPPPPTAAELAKMDADRLAEREKRASSPISPTKRKVEETEETLVHKVTSCMVHFSLYGFNIVSFFACLLIVAGQVAAMSQINFKSPELVVLGITIVALWVLSGLGLYGIKTAHRQLLRMYAFMLLVLILLQVSIVVTLYQNLDSSFMDEFAKVIKSLCISPFDDEEATFANLTEFEQDDDMNVTLDDSGSFDGFGGNVTSAVDTYLQEMENSEMGMFEMLCACTELPGPRACIQAWVELQFYKAFVIVNCLFAFESVCAILAWKYVDVIDDEEVLKMRKKRNRPISGGIAGAGLGAVGAGFGAVGDIADLAQNVPGAAVAGKLIAPGAAVAEKLIGPGWAIASGRLAAGIALGEDLQEKARHEAVLLTRTWYFEGTVLFASLIVFLVLAVESYTTRPSQDMLVVLRMGAKTASFFEFSLCLSRACRGKLIVFIYKWLKNAVLFSQAKCSLRCS